MRMHVGFLLLCCLGFAAAGEEQLTPSQFQAPPNWNHGHTTTVCIQLRGPLGPELCGPMVSSSDSTVNPDTAGSRNSNPSPIVNQQQSQFREQTSFVAAQPNPTPLRSAVLQGFIGNGPVYQIEPGRAVEALSPLVRLNQPPPPMMSMMRAPQEPLPNQQGPCLEHGMRSANSYPVMMSSPSEMAPPPLQNQPPKLRTIPFAPFGFEQQPGPPQTFQMRQPMGLRASSMGAMRSADCQDNLDQPRGGSSMRASSSSLESEQQQNVKVLKKQCEEQEQEILQKKVEIDKLKQQLEKMAQSPFTKTEQKAKQTEQDVYKETEVKMFDDKKVSDGSKSNFSGKKK